MQTLSKTIQEMSNNSEVRIPKIIDLILQPKPNGTRHTHEDIARQLGVHRKTIEHDLANLRDSDTWKAYLYSRFLQSDHYLSHSDNEENKREAHRSLIKLLHSFHVTNIGSVTLQQMNVVDLSKLSPEELAKLDDAARLLFGSRRAVFDLPGSQEQSNCVKVTNRSDVVRQDQKPTP